MQRKTFSLNLKFKDLQLVEEKWGGQLDLVVPFMFWEETLLEFLKIICWIYEI